MNKKRKAAALVLSCVLIVAMITLGMATLSRSIGENIVTQRHMESMQAFCAAEAGANRALYELRTNFNWNGINNVSVGTDSSYTVSVAVDGNNRVATVQGFSGQPSINRNIDFSLKSILKENGSHPVFIAFSLVHTSSISLAVTEITGNVTGMNLKLYKQDIIKQK